MDLLPLWARLALGVALAAFIGFRIHQRWKDAGQQSDAIFARQAAMRTVHSQLLQDPAWHRIWQELEARGYRVDVSGAQLGAYTFGLITLWGGADYVQAYGQQEASHMNVYLRGPKQIVASLAYATGDVQIRECGFGEWPPEAL